MVMVRVAGAEVEQVMDDFMGIHALQKPILDKDQGRRAHVSAPRLRVETVSRHEDYERRRRRIDPGASLDSFGDRLKKIGVVGGGPGLPQLEPVTAYRVERPSKTVVAGFPVGFLWISATTAAGQCDQHGSDEPLHALPCLPLGEHVSHGVRSDVVVPGTVLQLVAEYPSIRKLGADVDMALTPRQVKESTPGGAVERSDVSGAALAHLGVRDVMLNSQKVGPAIYLGMPGNGTTRKQVEQRQRADNYTDHEQHVPVARHALDEKPLLGCVERLSTPLVVVDGHVPPLHGKAYHP